MNKPILESMNTKKKRWSKTEPTKNGEKRTCVREIENGFIVEVSSDEEVNGEYKYTCTETYMKENPLADDNLEATVLGLIKEALK